MSETMRALVGGVGTEWEVRDVDVPTPRPGQLLVRVGAAGLNRADVGMLLGTYNPGGRRLATFTAGMELAGEVVAVGADVDPSRVGDRVMGTTLGAFARYALVDQRHAVAVPETLGWIDAAALPVGLTTEHDALVTQAGFAAGQRVLVVGATSGVGVLAVRMATALGAARVIATTTSSSKVEALRTVGADVVVDTSTDALAAVVNDATSGEGVDVVLDHVGGESFGDLIACTRIRGTIINIGRLGGRRATIDLDQLSFRRIRAQGTTFSVRTADERAEVFAALEAEVMPAVTDGRIRAVVDSVFPFEDAAAAMQRLRSNQVVGKIVLDMA